ncbi:hypothetical protein DFS34DRAFT_172708 [Phlyctochytrium arcticum]|nr:hypothetical protein DFS34DRAFT_172708 [Phlyctochytrium arcticum]
MSFAAALHQVTTAPHSLSSPIDINSDVLAELRALRLSFLEKRLRLLADERVAAQYDIIKLRKGIQQKQDAIQEYKSFLNTWRETLSRVDKHTREAMNRSYRDEALVNKHPRRVLPPLPREEDFVDQDNVTDNPYRSGPDGIPNLSPVQSPGEGVDGDGVIRLDLTGTMDLPGSGGMQAPMKLDSVLDDLMVDAGLGGDVLGMTDMNAPAMPGGGVDLSGQAQGLYDMFGDSIGALGSSSLQMGGDFGMSGLDNSGFTTVPALSTPNPATQPVPEDSSGLGGGLVDTWDIAGEAKPADAEQAPTAELGKDLDFDEFLV